MDYLYSTLKICTYKDRENAVWIKWIWLLEKKMIWLILYTTKINIWSNLFVKTKNSKLTLRYTRVILQLNHLEKWKILFDDKIHCRKLLE